MNSKPAWPLRASDCLLYVQRKYFARTAPEGVLVRNHRSVRGECLTENASAITDLIRVVGRERAELDGAYGRKNINQSIAVRTGLL